MKAAFFTEGTTITQSALFSKSRGIPLSGMPTTAFKTE
jgi:hypothetical protein